MNDEKRMIGNYAVEQSIHIGKKEVVFCVDKRAEHPYVVCYCDYNNPFSAPWPTDTRRHRGLSGSYADFL